MELKIVHLLPEDIAIKGSKIARHACERYAGEVFGGVAIASVLAGKYILISLAVLAMTILGRIYNRLLRTYERKSWNLMVIFSVAAVLCGYGFSKIEFENELFQYYPIIQDFIPGLFAIPAAVVADRLGVKIELLYYRSEGYDYRGRLGHISYVEDSF